MNWLYYLGEANLYLIVFYLGYCLFLSRETHYTLNRIYLLSSCVFAFVLPVLQLGFLKPHILFPAAAVDPNLYPDGPAQWQETLETVYGIGACVFAILLFVKLFKLWVIIRQSYISRLEKHKLIHIEEPNTAFSFFNYLFVAEETETIDFITRHEMVHIRQKHSADIIFTELLKVVSWFNPVIYLLQRSLKNIHEFIADEKTVAYNDDRLGYSTFLINNAYGLSGSSLTHSFFNNNLLKRRILMLNGKRSGKLTVVKYLLIAPLFFGLLCVSTLSFSKSYGWFDVAPMKTVPQQQTPTLQLEPVQKPKVTNVKAKKSNKTVKFPPPQSHTSAKNPKVAIQDVKVEPKKTIKFPPPVVKPNAAAKAAKPEAIQTVELSDPEAKPAKAVDRRPPPPPPVEAKATKTVKFPPPVVKPDKKAVVRFPPPVVKPDPATKQVDKRPPPPPPEPPQAHNN